MKKVLILCLHRAGRSPSQRFRFEQYLEHLSAHGYSFEISYLLNERDDRVFYSRGHLASKLGIVLKSLSTRAGQLLDAGRYDLAFVQREALMLGTAFFERAMARRIPLIFDFDDSIWLQAISESNKAFGFLKNPAKTARIIEASALVLAGNAFLAEYARRFNSRVVVVPTTIDTDAFQPVPRPRSPAVCIGWTGSFTTIEHFALAVPALVRIRERYGARVRFKIIGDGNYYCHELDTRGIPWRASTEVEDIGEMDIGLMPLPDTEWAQGKCGLKGLQYMALSIPTVMSPVGVNKDIVTQGVNGFLPRNEDEWFECLCRLVEDEALRQSVGQEGRKTVVEKFSVASWKDEYLRLFDQATAAKH